MSTSADSFWRGFRHDPRSPAHASLLASDADRERALGVLTEAYADGRLGVADLESRTVELASAGTLREVRDLLADLVPDGDPCGPEPMDARVARELAVAGFRWRLAGDVAVLVGPGTLCVLLWWLAGSGFFWPIWVLVYTGVPPVLTLLTAGSRIAARERELMAERPDVAA